ncbi:MAG: endonuclease/exonuclease/phosphatase family protein [bacterium]
MPWSLILLLFFSSCANFLPFLDNKPKNLEQNVKTNSTTFTVFHYNIKELTTDKINNPSNEQMLAVKKIISKYEYDVLSINEIQYDLPGVPTLAHKTAGENLVRFATSIGLNSSRWTPIFEPANTGSAAARNIDGNYFVEESEMARKNADPINYGLFPAQYSTAGLLRLRVSEKFSINRLKWREFNPKAEPTNYATADGRSLPNDMVLFDKNFNHAITKIDGKTVHFIFLHTVPSYHFGNKKSPNYVRNADQLKFLEWYTTGKTDIEVPLDRSRWPMINKKDGVVIVGDLNADVAQDGNPGGQVLKRLMKSLRPWMKNPGPTNESSGFAPKPFQLSLDYILVSSNIKILDAQVIRPESNFYALGCSKSSMFKVKRNLRAKRKIVEYLDKDKQKTCYATASQDYFDIKTASDHFPIFAKLSLD